MPRRARPRFMPETVRRIETRLSPAGDVIVTFP